MSGVVLWDFDGTLAWREGLWSGCVLEVLDEHEPDHGATLESIRAFTKGRFPWHRHETPHPELADPEEWWRALAPLLCGAMTGNGIAHARARELCAHVRERFVDGSIMWRLFDDTRAALTRTREAGRQNVVVSNHVPELSRLAGELGVDDLLDEIFSSAVTGYEKPHPEAFRLALRGRGRTEEAWMVGDNPHADVAGAEALGMRAVLIRTAGEARHTAPDALAAAELILAAE